MLTETDYKMFYEWECDLHRAMQISEDSLYVQMRNELLVMPKEQAKNHHFLSDSDELGKYSEKDIIKCGKNAETHLEQLRAAWVRGGVPGEFLDVYEAVDRKIITESNRLLLVKRETSANTHKRKTENEIDR